jgi:hypothetical protein
MITLWSIFRASQALQGVAFVVVALLGVKAWQMYERKIGAERYAAEQERKANEDNRKADEVRDAVAVAKPSGGLRDPAKREAARN